MELKFDCHEERDGDILVYFMGDYIGRIIKVVHDDKLCFCFGTCDYEPYLRIARATLIEVKAWLDSNVRELVKIFELEHLVPGGGRD